MMSDEITISPETYPGAMQEAHGLETRPGVTPQLRVDETIPATFAQPARTLHGSKTR
jgi:hypothetical protein